MPIEAGALIVIGLYVLCLVVIWYISPRLPGAVGDTRARPWRRNVRFWASLVAVAQIVVYAVFS